MKKVLMLATALTGAAFFAPAQAATYQFNQVGGPVGFKPVLKFDGLLPAINFTTTGTTITGVLPSGFALTDSSVGSFGTTSVNMTFGSHITGSIHDNGLNENFNGVSDSNGVWAYTLLSDHFPNCGVLTPCSGTGTWGEVSIPEPATWAVFALGFGGILLVRHFASNNKPRAMTI